MRSLRTLALHVATRIEEDDEYDYGPYHSEIPIFSEYLARIGRLHDFITAALNLDDLTFSLGWDNPKPPARLIDVVGDSTWNSLRAASFTRISTNEKELVQIYERHTDSHREIRLDTIRLHKESWRYLLQAVRKVLNLEKATIAGQLSSDDPVETYFLDLPPEINGGRKAAVGIAVENCLVEGGEGLLLDLSLQAEG